MGLGKGLGGGFGLGLGRGRGYGYGRGFGQGKGGFSGYSCVKFVFFGFNVFFWLLGCTVLMYVLVQLLGCAVLGVGIWLQASRGSYAPLSPTYTFLSATALCIAAGILILAVGFFGCCGAIMESKCLLMTYFVLIVLIFILEVVAGVLAFIYGAEIERVVGDELHKGIRTKYPPQPGPDDDGLREIWRSIQNVFSCCGVYNYTDWYKIDAWPGEQRVPRECCKQNTTCNDLETPADYFPTGCLTKMKTQFKVNLYILGIVGICIGVIQILGLVASMALFCCLRQEKYYDD